MDNLGIVIDRKAKEPAYRQVYLQICRKIADGSLHANARLPKIRDLAKSLGIARNTVESAYKQLALEGYARGTRGVGYVVEELDLNILKEAASRDQRLLKASLPKPAPHPLGDSFGCTYDFSYGNRSSHDLPIDIWRTCANEALSSSGSFDAARYIDPLGLFGLREQLARHITKTRGVACVPEQIVLQPGTQAALSTIARMLAPEKRRVAIEEPGYGAAVDTLRSCGCNLIPVPVYRPAEETLAALENSKANCYFCTPSNQFPLGFIMPLATRLKVIDWARRTDAYIIEDDYCCEYRYDGSSQVSSMQSLDPERVIYLGTLSKVLTPAIRISYMVLPPALLERWYDVYAHRFCDLPWLDQRILELFMEKGYWERYVHTTVNTYRKRHDLLISSIDKHLKNSVRILGANAGLHILLGDERNRSQEELIALARKKDVRVYETSCYWSQINHPLKNFVLVGFSAIDERLIDEGIRRLGQAWYG